MVFFKVMSCNLLHLYRRFEYMFFLVYKTHIAVNQTTVFLTFTATENFVHVCNTRNFLLSLD